MNLAQLFLFWFDRDFFKKYHVTFFISFLFSYFIDGVTTLTNLQVPEQSLKVETLIPGSGLQGRWGAR